MMVSDTLGLVVPTPVLATKRLLELLLAREKSFTRHLVA